jgi:hypothetical protein
MFITIVITPMPEGTVIVITPMPGGTVIVTTPMPGGKDHLIHLLNIVG